MPKLLIIFYELIGKTGKKSEQVHLTTFTKRNPPHIEG